MELNNKLYMLFPACDAKDKSSVYIKTYECTDIDAVNTIVNNIAAVNMYLKYEPCKCFYYRKNYHEILNPIKELSREKTHDYLTSETKLKQNLKRWKCLDGNEDTVLLIIRDGGNDECNAIIDNCALMEETDNISDADSKSISAIEPSGHSLWQFFSAHRNPTRNFHVIAKHPVNMEKKYSAGYRSTLNVTETEAEANCNRAIGGSSSKRAYFYYFKRKGLYIRYFCEGDTPKNQFHAYTFDKGNGEEMAKIPNEVRKFLEKWT